MLRNWKCILEYDGTRYFGWQRQPKRPTIQAVLEDAIERLAGEPAAVIGSGRTDTGVHARGQVASFKLAADRDRETLYRGLNALLPDDIRILRVEAAPMDFHARFDARAKRYEYRVHIGAVPPVFERGYCLHHPATLDLGRMQEAASPLIGTHDFRAFARSQPLTRTTVRSMRALDIWRRSDTMVFALEADGFLHTMVRSIVGTLLQVGRGKREPKDVEAILTSRDRGRCGPPAPSRGLFLMEVFY